MPSSLHTWYSLPDLDILAQREAVLEGEIPLARLVRLAELLNSDAGSVKARLVFRQHQKGTLILTLQCEAALELICQRCLEPVSNVSVGEVEFGLVATEAELSQLPEAYEAIVLDGERFSPAELIEDELIVSLPLVPRHVDRDQCGPLAGKLGSIESEAKSGSRASAPMADR